MSLGIDLGKVLDVICKYAENIIKTTECIATGSLSVMLVGPQLVFGILLLSISIWLGAFNILFFIMQT